MNIYVDRRHLLEFYITHPEDVERDHTVRQLIEALDFGIKPQLEVHAHITSTQHVLVVKPNKFVR